MSYNHDILYTGKKEAIGSYNRSNLFDVVDFILLSFLNCLWSSRKVHLLRALSDMHSQLKIAAARKNAGGIKRHQQVSLLLAQCANNYSSAVCRMIKELHLFSRAVRTGHFENNQSVLSNQ